MNTEKCRQKTAYRKQQRPAQPGRNINRGYRLEMDRLIEQEIRDRTGSGSSEFQSSSTGPHTIGAMPKKGTPHTVGREAATGSLPPGEKKKGKHSGAESN